MTGARTRPLPRQESTSTAHSPLPPEASRGALARPLRPPIRPEVADSGAAYVYRLSDEPIVACCFGASPAPCPCDDHGAPGNGCANRQHPEGANLAASAPGGDPQVSDDDVVLTAQGMRSFSWCLFLQGTGQVDFGLGEPFGAGLLCAGGELTRLGFKSTGPGMASYPGPHDEPLSLRGGIPPGGGTAFYQVVYRTPLLLGLCGPEGRGFNSTIAVAISWTP